MDPNDQRIFLWSLNWRSNTAGLDPSMSRAGNPYDNAAMESFSGTYVKGSAALNSFSCPGFRLTSRCGY